MLTICDTMITVRTNSKTKYIAQAIKKGLSIIQNETTNIDPVSLSQEQIAELILAGNLPDDYELDHNAVKNTLHLFNPDYFCLVDEIATTGTKHMHIFIYSKSPIRFSTLKNRFPVAHIDKANGSVTENRDYLRKEGR